MTDATEPTRPARSTLFPEAPPRFVQADVPLDDLPPDDQLLSPPPEKALVDSVRALGVLDPVLLRRLPPGDVRESAFLVLSGCRRIKAARLAGLADVPCRLVIGADDLDRTAPDWDATLGLSVHGTRRANLAADLARIEALVRGGAGERAIARATGLKPAEVKQRRRLLGLHPALREAFDRGLMAPSVAGEAVALSPGAQARLAARLAEPREDGRPRRVTSADVLAVRSTAAVRAAATLPLDLIAGMPGADDLEPDGGDDGRGPQNADGPGTPPGAACVTSSSEDPAEPISRPTPPSYPPRPGEGNPLGGRPDLRAAIAALDDPVLAGFLGAALSALEALARRDVEGARTALEALREQTASGPAPRLSRPARPGRAA